MKALRFGGICLLALLLLSTAALAEESALKIATVTGKVLVRSAGAKDWTEAKIGQAVNPKDTIKTEDDSLTTIEFTDKTTVSLKPKSEITVEEIAWDAKLRKANIKMDIGKLRAIIKKGDAPSDFVIKTPTAICGARGTIEYVNTDGQTTDIYVPEGTVDFTNTTSGETFSITGGNGSTAGSDGSTTDPTPPGPNEQQEYESGFDTPVGETYTEPEGGTNNQGGNTGETLNTEETPERPGERPASQIT